MILKKIEFANYRSFEQKEIAFDPQFNVLIGINGIGKTSILEGIAVLFSRALKKFTPTWDQALLFSKNDIRIGSIGKTLTGRASIEVLKRTLDFSLAESFEEGLSKHQSLQPSQSVRDVRLELDVSKQDSTVGVPIVVFYTTDRSGFRVTRKSQARPGRAGAYQGALRDKLINYRRFVEWLKAKRRLRHEREADKRIIEIISKALSTFLPGFEELDVEDDTWGLYVNKNGNRLRIDQLSDGERNFIALVVDIARRLVMANPGSNDPLNEGKGIILIDELEIHLHPKWQRDVVLNLQKTFPSLQFITTTHSPFVIQSLRPGQLINLDPATGESEFADNSIEDIAEFVMGIKMPQKSKRYQEMMSVAEEYFRLLRQGEPETEAERANLKRKLDELSAPFSEDPAFMALLKLERESAFGG